MRRLPVLLVAMGMATGSLFAVHAVGQDMPGGAGGPPTQGAGPAGDNVPPPLPPRGAPGGVHIIPPFVMSKLNLTEDQQKQVADLEKETKAKLDKILTPEQQKIMAETRPPRGGRGGPGGGGPGGGGPGGGGGAGGPAGGPPQ